LIIQAGLNEDMIEIDSIFSVSAANWSISNKNVESTSPLIATLRAAAGLKGREEATLTVAVVKILTVFEVRQ
jgi:hypothetical protein